MKGGFHPFTPILKNCGGPTDRPVGDRDGGEVDGIMAGGAKVVSHGVILVRRGRNVEIVLVNVGVA